MLNSKIKISAGSNMTYANGQQLRVDIVRAVSGGSTTRGLHSAYSDSTNDYGWIHRRALSGEWISLHGQWIDSPSLASGTTVTYSLAFKNGGGTNTTYWCHEGGASYLTIEEIAV
jgi:hypothetical protein